MENKNSFVWTGDTITVIVDGKSHIAKSGTNQYNALRSTLLSAVSAGTEPNWDDVRKHLTPALSLQQWAGDKFVIQGDQILHQGFPVPQMIAQRIRQMANEGKSPGPWFAFYERLARNPSHRSVQALYTFLMHENIPIDEDGTILAYKGVTAELLDCHSRTFDNTPGQVLEMPRNRVNDNPKEGCSVGFHVGSRAYAKSFCGSGGALLIVRVDPEHVVSVPFDESYQKMRVCKYTVVGFDSGTPMPSTSIDLKEGEVHPAVAYGSGEVDDEVDDDDEVDHSDVDEDEDDRSPAWHPDNTAGGRGDHYHLRPEGSMRKKSTGHKKVDVDAKLRRRLGKLGPKELIKETTDTLRAYAGSLKIVGASKIGGKALLVAKISQVRRKGR